MHLYACMLQYTSALDRSQACHNHKKSHTLNFRNSFKWEWEWDWATRPHGYTAIRLHGYTAIRPHGYTATRPPGFGHTVNKRRNLIDSVKCI